jgi:lantibiotic modifying enzyme
MLGHDRYLDAAIGAAWDSWESSNPAPTLCCGLAGRAYALLRFYRHTGEPKWLERARQLGAWAAREGVSYPEHPQSLYKGAFGVAIMAADLEDPEWGRMPFFEPAGYRL